MLLNSYSQMMPTYATDQTLQSFLAELNPMFWSALAGRSMLSSEFEEVLFLSNLRKKALARGLSTNSPQEKIRLAIIGGYSFYPLTELIAHYFFMSGSTVEIFVGNYNSYVSEILDPASPLYSFNPHYVLLLPSSQEGLVRSGLAQDRSHYEKEAKQRSAQLLSLCEKIYETTRAQIILGNFVPSCGFDLGPLRSKTLGSDWNFSRLINLELGLTAPAYVHICDLELLACRRGLIRSKDERAWFESKQPASADFLVDLAKEIALLISSVKKGPKKVLVLDLDNTLWGGVIGDDGLEGIDLGDTSPRGEAYKAFQKSILSLNARGILLAVCSKNDRDKAIEPFEKHPEMILRMNHFVSFKANWEPKSENIKAIAAELNLGLDSLVFVDDNPAEIEIVRQFVPEVTSLLLPEDPATYVSFLQDSRLFETTQLTAEDSLRTVQYQQENQRRAALTSVTDMPAYLASLEMTATISDFNPIDAPRITQLINKSNQFNLTTQRRAEAEVLHLINHPDFASFTVRLADKFGDHGLIAVVITKRIAAALHVDTWLMSCRVLNRQVEEIVINEIVRLAQLHSCEQIVGTYIASPKNAMVKDLYPRLGFKAQPGLFTLMTNGFTPFTTAIKIKRNPDASK